MVDIQTWMQEFTDKLQNSFPNRIWFLGLQGSYGRGEANENSDIDVVVILDVLSPDDLKTYAAMLDQMSDRELICGFISGRDEIMSWDRSDLFQFYHDTTPVLGTLDPLLPLIDRGDVKRAVRMGAGNLYHGCVHNMLHEKNEEILRDLYKSAAFVIQALYFCQSGRYIKSKPELMDLVDPAEREILRTGINLKAGSAVELDAMSTVLFRWSGSAKNLSPREAYAVSLLPL